jgi:hypothetical protein
MCEAASTSWASACYRSGPTWDSAAALQFKAFKVSGRHAGARARARWGRPAPGRPGDVGHVVVRRRRCGRRLAIHRAALISFDADRAPAGGSHMLWPSDERALERLAAAREDASHAWGAGPQCSQRVCSGCARVSHATERGSGGAGRRGASERRRGARVCGRALHRRHRAQVRITFLRAPPGHTEATCTKRQ